MRKVIKYISWIIPGFIVTWYSLLVIFNSQVDFVDFLVQAVGGGVGAYRAFILLIAVLIFLIFLYTGKKAAFGDVKKMQVRFYYFISILGFMSFFILGGEFNAPKMTFASFMNFKSSFSSERVVKRSDVEFELKSCESMGNKITCNLKLYNFGPDDVLRRGDRSYIIDNENNTANVSLFTVGGQNYGNLPFNAFDKYRINLPEGADAELKMSFESNSFDNAELVRALYINLNMGGKKESMVFRNISL